MKPKISGTDSPNSSANMSDVSDTEQSQPPKKTDHVANVLEILRTYEPEKMRQMMFLYFDPFRKRLVLTEA